MVLYKEFKVGDLFEPYLPRNKKLDKKERGRYPLICGSGVNNGVDGYTDEEIDVYENELTLSTRGSSGATFYQEGKFVLNNNSMVLKLKEEYPKNKGALIYISTHLNKLPYEGYSNYPTKTGIVKEVLELPVKTLEDTEPDWEYMEEYIKQKELAYIDKLNKEFEQKKEQLIEILGEESEYINIEELPTAKFKVGDLFEISNVKGVNVGGIEESKEGYPYITRTSFNNGVHSYTKGIPKVKRQSKNTYSLGMLNLDFFYQKEEWYAGQYVRCITPRFAISDELANYFKAILDKHKEVFRGVLVRNFDEMFLGTEIELPINPEVSEIVPDWNAMEKYIARVELQLLNRVINTLNT